jgi:lipoprotein-anchoring transpeptidase ErfK/SrfK
MRGFTIVVALYFASASTSPAHAAEVLIAINKTTQRMTVSVDGQERYTWPISTGTADYSTPIGSFKPSRMAIRHYSREWDNAPMPYSIFFTDAGHAIHGSRAVGRLGTPASHGCVRLSPTNASMLFRIVSAKGPGNTRIEIAGSDPVETRSAGAQSGMGHYGRLTSFNPLTDGIMARPREHRRRP